MKLDNSKIGFVHRICIKQWLDNKVIETYSNPRYLDKDEKVEVAAWLETFSGYNAVIRVLPDSKYTSEAYYLAKVDEKIKIEDLESVSPQPLIEFPQLKAGV